MSEPNQSRPDVHIPVLADEVVRLLEPRAGETYADCTAGRGGHAARMSLAIGAGGTVVLNDLDGGCLDAARLAVEAGGSGARMVGFRGNFADLPRRMAEGGSRRTWCLRTWDSHRRRWTMRRGVQFYA